MAQQQHQSVFNANNSPSSFVDEQQNLLFGREEYPPEHHGYPTAPNVCDYIYATDLNSQLFSTYSTHLNDYQQHGDQIYIPSYITNAASGAHFQTPFLDNTYEDSNYAKYTNQFVDQAAPFAAHFTQPELKCASCKSAIKRLSGGKGKHHLHANSPKSPSKPRCDICSKSFGRTSDYSRHLRTVHEKLRWPCVLGCHNNRGEGWCREDRLKEHIRRAHPGST